MKYLKDKTEKNFKKIKKYIENELFRIKDLVQKISTEKSDENDTIHDNEIHNEHGVDLENNINNMNITNEVDDINDNNLLYYKIFQKLDSENEKGINIIK